MKSYKVRCCSLILVGMLSASCSQKFSEVSYVCEGTITEIFKPDGSETFVTKERIALIVESDTIRLEGVSYFFPLMSLVGDVRNGGLNRLNICTKTSTQIEFDNYGCDFDKNVVTPSALVAEGFFNLVIGQLYINDYRKVKYSADSSIKLKAKSLGRKIGNYTCVKQ